METLRELNRRRENKKIRRFACSIVERCEEEEFTLSDMRDLAVILPGLISEAIISEEEKTSFTVSPDIYDTLKDAIYSENQPHPLSELKTEVQSALKGSTNPAFRANLGNRKLFAQTSEPK